MMEIEYLIREKSQKCKQLFQRCLKIVDIGDDDWLEQKSAEFNWWASGLNADKTGPGSLDARLRLRPDIRDVVADLLKNLMAALARSQEIGRCWFVVQIPSITHCDICISHSCISSPRHLS